MSGHSTTAVELMDASERAVAAEAWRALEAEVPASRLAASWDWVDIWLDRYGDVVPHRFAIAPGRGATLVTEELKRRGPLRIRRLRLGTVGEPKGESVYTSYNGPLARPADEAEFMRALAERLLAERGWDELVLERFSPTAAGSMLAALPGFAVAREDAPTVDLRAASQAGGDVLATLRARTRQQTRRSMRDLGPLEVEVAETHEWAADILEELIDLHQRRWVAEGESGLFSSGRFSGFHRDLIRRLLPTGRVMLFRVRAEAGTVGCVYNLIDGDRVISYLQGLMPFEGGKLKPGFVSHVLCMQECFERGYSEYDLLPEPIPYKLELSNTMRELVTGRFVRRRPRTVPILAGRRVKGLVRERRAGH